PSMVLPNPNASAWARSLSPPICIPSEVKAVLQEIVSAWIIVEVWPLPQLSPPKFRSVAVLCGSWSSLGDGRTESGVYCPVDSAAAAALSTGQYTPDSVLPSPNELQLPQSTATLRNFGGESCGNGQTSTMIHALTISCNTAFTSLGMQIGGDKLRAQADAFGFGSTIDGLELPEAKSVFPDSVDQAQTAQSAIGQFDVRVTPLQMAQVVSAIANRGRMMKPYVVDELEGPDLRQIARTQPKELGQPISSQVADQLITMMKSVVTSGTGTKAQISGVSVAGKTGTA